MRTFLLCLTCVLAAFLLTAWTHGASTPSALEASTLAPGGLPPGDTLYLPVEVIGGNLADSDPATTDTSVTVTVRTSQAADSLYLMGDNMGYHYLVPSLHGGTGSEVAPLLGGYDQKASVRLRTLGVASDAWTDWLPLQDETTDAWYPERLYRGPDGTMGGPYQVARFSVATTQMTGGPIGQGGAAAGQIPAGTHEIEWRFNGTDGISSGYSIIELDLRTATATTGLYGAQGTSVMTTISADVADLPGDNAVFERRYAVSDTSTAAGIAAGREAFAAQNTLLASNLEHAALGLDFKVPITAACLDCHGGIRQHGGYGWDLAFFNVSRQRIFARARYAHGLPSETAWQIADFAMSMRDSLSSFLMQERDGAPRSKARPWSSPLLPGPGQDNAPYPDKIAGADIRWSFEPDHVLAYSLMPTADTRAVLDTIGAAGPTPRNFLELEQMAAAQGVTVALDTTAGAPRVSGLGCAGTNPDDAYCVGRFAIPRPYQMHYFEWMPDVHPLDEGMTAWHQEPKIATRTAEAGLLFADAAGYQDPTSNARRDALIAATRQRRFQRFRGGLNNWIKLMTAEAVVCSARSAPCLENTSLAKYSVHQEQAIKMLTIETLFRLMDLGHEVYGDDTDSDGVGDQPFITVTEPGGVQGVDVRQVYLEDDGSLNLSAWIYRVSPHLSVKGSENGPYPRTGPGVDRDHTNYKGHIWYEGAWHGNWGMGINKNDQSPFDNNYHNAMHTLSVQDDYQIPRMAMFALGEVGMLQQYMHWRCGPEHADVSPYGSGWRCTAAPGVGSVTRQTRVNWYTSSSTFKRTGQSMLALDAALPAFQRAVPRYLLTAWGPNYTQRYSAAAWETTVSNGVAANSLSAPGTVYDLGANRVTKNYDKYETDLATYYQLEKLAEWEAEYPGQIPDALVAAIANYWEAIRPDADWEAFGATSGGASGSTPDPWDAFDLPGRPDKVLRGATGSATVLGATQVDVTGDGYSLDVGLVDNVQWFAEVEEWSDFPQTATVESFSGGTSIYRYGGLVAADTASDGSLTRWMEIRYQPSIKRLSARTCIATNRACELLASVTGIEAPLQLDITRTESAFKLDYEPPGASVALQLFDIEDAYHVLGVVVGSRRTGESTTMTITLEN